MSLEDVRLIQQVVELRQLGIFLKAVNHFYSAVLLKAVQEAIRVSGRHCDECVGQTAAGTR
jgi:hypothetical protein